LGIFDPNIFQSWSNSGQRPHEVGHGPKTTDKIGDPEMIRNTSNTSK
jgi:hypothetical protein